jgi:hypothetical protein
MKRGECKLMILGLQLYVCCYVLYAGVLCAIYDEAYEGCETVLWELWNFASDDVCG